MEYALTSASILKIIQTKSSQMLPCIALLHTHMHTFLSQIYCSVQNNRKLAFCHGRWKYEIDILPHIQLSNVGVNYVDLVEPYRHY